MTTGLQADQTEQHHHPDVTPGGEPRRHDRHSLRPRGGDTDPHRIPVTVPTHRQRIRLQGNTSMNETLDVYEPLAAVGS
ncbi:hypothetical protein GCM10009735_83920 [Actinomadura chokoriensis]